MRNWKLRMRSRPITIIVMGHFAHRQASTIHRLIQRLQNRLRQQPRVNPHADDIKRIESDAGVFLSRVAKLILHDEGNRSRPYLDSGGTVTIGVGRSLQTNGISVAELHAIVDEIDYGVLLAKTHVQNGRVRIGSLALANKIFVKPLTQHDIQLLLTDDLKNVAHEAEGVFSVKRGRS